ncbi:peptidoglycan DD-metalloendopeptidase family protein [Virgibacillus halodenitrificans]|nr:peptidoglycan DD-metalloendopeptidase family protein [Virgibacillus halodenitrificans]
MRLRFIFCLFSSIIIGGLLGCSPSQEETSEIKAEERETNMKAQEKLQPKRIADVFLDGDYEQIYTHLSKPFQNEISLKQFKKTGKNFNQGVEAYYLLSELPLTEDTVQYVWADNQETKGMVAVVDKNQVITGMRILPLETFQETDNRYTKTVFQQPFDGDWFVFWGGTNKLVNYHYEHKNQRYAYDLIKMIDNQSYKGDSSKNDSYYAFGENVLAPADGNVVDVENAIEDNEPVGSMNTADPAGNYVVIDHGNEEFSFLAHFKKGSVKVKPGDEVKAGELLGQVGNSGNSSEPHIHFHVGDLPDLEKGKSIRIQFKNEEDWVQGDTIQGVKNTK